MLSCYYCHDLFRFPLTLIFKKNVIPTSYTLILKSYSQLVGDSDFNLWDFIKGE